MKEAKKNKIDKGSIYEGMKLNGFTVTRIRDIEETGGRLVEMEHDETGAGLVWCDNGAENKLFSVGFRTLPEDSTGVFHILEHSVLCGSDSFPVKEPFVELLKTSMNTFLNAMTYPDKTLYPVSSRIKQDYLNLAEVYLDAVFRPNILHDPNIFYQEGWHIDTGGDEPVYKGVVFNEMKGAMSDVDQIAERTMNSLLFPDNCYGFNSGGDPEVIPELSYERFVKTYRRYYHPSNAYFYLDGDVPLCDTLEMIESYLAGAGRLENLPEAAEQVPVVRSAAAGFASNDEADKPVVAFGRICAGWADRDKLLALSVLLEQLADSNESPLKRAVLSAGLAEDMEIFVMDGIMQPYIMMLFRGVSPGEDESVEDAAQRLLAIVKQTIEKLASDGFSKKDLEASINRLDFRFREYPEPQGLYRANAVFNSWLYGGDPSLYLRTNEAVAALREMAETDAYEKLASKLIGDVSKYSSLILTPDTGLEAAQAKLEADRIAAAIDAMDSRERKALEDLNEDLLRWQQTPDPAEDIAKIPMLRLSDIDPMPEIIATEEKTVEGVRVLFHPVQTNGIVYINAYFPVTQLSAEDLPKAALITDLLKDLPTSDHDVLALQSEMKMHVGSISFGLDILSSDGETAVCTPCIRVRASVLEEKLSHAEDLITEILTRTSFDDISLLRELMKQIDEDGKRGAVTSGHRLALYEARSHWSARDAATEAVSGYSFLQFMHGMADASDEELRAFSGSAAGIIAESISRQNVIISVTSTEYADVSRLISMLPEGQAMPEVMSLSSPLPRRMGIQIPAAVSFSVTAYEMLSDGSRMNGNMSVAANIISLAQLWNEIRVQGGAYGAAMSAGRTGTLFCYTYRDPSPSRSLGIYRTIPDFISAFAASEDADIDGFIISTIASTEPLLSPAAKGRAADDFFISGFTDEDRIRFRREMLETTPSDLAAQREALERMAARGTVCVVGPKAALEGCEGLEVFEL